jgi:coproporphyrinogen III oxidase
MPPLARWEYNYQPSTDSPEGKIQAFLTARDYLNE